jgi:D-alanyl-lipoteichoic acid acyltransferase DltB (MBOAT superfamily)
VSFFPLLVAGPIERANHLLPQVQKNRFFNYTQAVEGCRLILWGMFKKVFIADSLAGIVDSIFANYQDQNGFTLIIGAIAFSFQIYGDFSGYSDIALGTAKLFGFELLSNFRFPYFSRDLAEFWRRWHISLSSWFRDYLYIPLGGSKNGKYTAIRNTFIIFLVSGFWHGASWNFIAWGFIHACGFLPLLLLNRNRKYVTDVVAQGRTLPNLKELWQMLTTFAFVTFAWIFFRIDDDILLSLDYIKHIGVSIVYKPGQFLMLPEGKMAIIYIIPLVLGDWYLRMNERLLRVPNNKFVRISIYCFLGTLILIQLLTYLNAKPSSFIYFQF